MSGIPPSTPPEPTRHPTLLVELFGEDFAPWFIMGLLAFAGFGGHALFNAGVHAGSPLAGALAAVGTFFAGVFALFILLRRS